MIILTRKPTLFNTLSKLIHDITNNMHCIVREWKKQILTLYAEPPVFAYDDDPPIPFRVSSNSNGTDSNPRKCSVPARKPSLRRNLSRNGGTRGSVSTRAVVPRFASTTPWELTNRRKVRSQLPRTQSSLDLPMNIFRKLPREVYECILLQLKRMYLGRGGKSCSECYVRDLHSLSLTSRAWDRVVNPWMYVGFPSSSLITAVRCFGIGDLVKCALLHERML